MPDACFRPPVIFLSGPVSTPNCAESIFEGRHTFFHETVLVVLGLLIIDYFVPDTDVGCWSGAAQAASVATWMADAPTGTEKLAVPRVKVAVNAISVRLTGCGSAIAKRIARADQPAAASCRTDIRLPNRSTAF